MWNTGNDQQEFKRRTCISELEDLVHGLGARSTPHKMTRADLLVLEVMVHRAEGCRLRYRECVHPPQQMLLPRFE